jgi:hypothetical protein
MAEMAQEQRDEFQRRLIDLVGTFGSGPDPTFPPPPPEWAARIPWGKILRKLGELLIIAADWVEGK